MQDRALVAAIVAGDPARLAETYDRYAAPLYTYCRFMLPGPDPMGHAASAVQDTFIVATAKLGGLRDPDKLRSWLHAVARNECLRQLGADSGAGSVTRLAGKPEPGPMPEVALPAELRQQVLKACADDTPTGRAYRASVAHRAGAFGWTGFPRPILPPGPRWWYQVQRHPRVAAAITAVALAVVVGGIFAMLIITIVLSVKL
jgi:DNA-directed RNA polymerase specialized sigma24 family protein